MARNNSRRMKSRCAFCNKGVFVSVPLKDKRIDLCAKHIDIIGCQTENHSGDYHSVECRFVKEAI
jgi:hypothetical protein